MSHVCMFYAQGKCRNGSDCVFVHSSSQSRDVNTFTRTIVNNRSDNISVRDRLGSVPRMSTPVYNGDPQIDSFNSRSIGGNNSGPLTRSALSRIQTRYLFFQPLL